VREAVGPRRATTETLLSWYLRDSLLGFGPGLAPSVGAAVIAVPLSNSSTWSVLLPERSAFGGLATLS
jgi:hypothetical protein